MKLDEHLFIGMLDRSPLTRLPTIKCEAMWLGAADMPLPGPEEFVVVYGDDATLIMVDKTAILFVDKMLKTIETL